MVSQERERIPSAVMGNFPDGKEARLVSPATKLCGFLIVLAVVFAAAYAAGARVGPVNASYVHQGGGGMQMGGSSP
jgi:hypothetical protein